jgi:hypothetical protein
MSTELQNLIDLAWEGRAALSPTSADPKIREAVEHVIADLNAGRCAWPNARAWASGRSTSGSRRRCC